MKQVIFPLVFLVLCLTLCAVNEVEPNNGIGDSGVQWATNGVYYGNCSVIDEDYWRIYGLAGDVLLFQYQYNMEMDYVQAELYTENGELVDNIYDPNFYQYLFCESKSLLIKFISNYPSSNYSFTVSGLSYHPQIPFTDGFTPDEFLHNSINSDCHWERSLLPVCYSNLALCEMEAGEDGILQSALGINLSGYPAPYLEFGQICLMEPGIDKGYVEYSIDGGNIWTAFPESALPFANNYSDEHSWFDADYTMAWSDWESTEDYNNIWAVTRFNLSEWGSCTDFRVRFRAEWGADSDGRFWALDYVKFSQDPPSLPVINYPHFMAMHVPTSFSISWSGQNATSYDVSIFGYQGDNHSYTVSGQSVYVELDPLTNYHLMIRANNQSGSSPWTNMNYSFTTNAYPTARSDFEYLFVSDFQISDYQRSSGFDSYIYVQEANIQVHQGEQVPISISSGFSPAYINPSFTYFYVMIDYNNDYQFVESELYMLYPQGDAPYTGTLSIPADAPPGTTRLRLSLNNVVDTVAYEIEDYNIQILAAPSIQVSGHQLLFDPVLAGYPATEMDLVLSNPGSAPLIIEALNFGGPNAEYFSLADDVTFPLTVNQSPVTLSLLYYPLSEGAHSADLSVISNAMNTLAPIALSGNAVAPNLYGAVNFNGYTKYVSFPTPLDSAALPALSIEAWIKSNEDMSAQCIMSKGEGSMEIYTTDMNGIRFIPTPGVELITTYFSLAADEWIHIACVYDPSSMLGRIYVNGIDMTWQNVGSNPLSQPIIATDNAWQIGRNTMGNSYFDGSIAEIRVWDAARSLQEIRNNMFLLQAPQTESLIANWRFDEPFGEIIYDSAHDMHGTLINCVPGDRINTPFIIGEGISSTQYPDPGTTVLNFTDCGLMLSDLSITSLAAITITRIDNTNLRDDLQENLWLMKHYDTISGNATFSFWVEDDLDSQHLPPQNFLLMTKEHNALRWYPEKRASSVDTANDMVVFANASMIERGFKILWEPMQAPTDLYITQVGEHHRLHWTEVPHTQKYRIYSSDNPEGPFDTLESDAVYSTYWNIPLNSIHKFFVVVSVVE
jgi:hypothetical protein